MLKNEKIITIYSVSLVLATISALIMLSSNVEQMSKVRTVEAKAEVCTGVVQTTKDWIKDLPTKFQTIWKIKQPEKSISKIVNPAKNSTVESIKKVSIVKKVENSFQSGSKIYRDWWNDPRVQYAYNISKGNMDFILTIEAESRWDSNAIWDQWNSFWLCQIHKRWNSKLQLQYRALKTDEEKINLCYEQYMWWVKRGVIKTRLYGYNYRKARAYLFKIK